MSRFVTAAFVLGLCLGLARAEDDEAHFKPKMYQPKSAEASGRSYSGTSYAPTQTSRSLGSSMKAAPEKHWTLFSSNARALDDKEMTKPLEQKGEPFKQQQEIRVPTIPPDPKNVPDKKPFIESGKKLNAAVYKASEPTHEKNPLLQPRQDIRVNE